MGSFIDNLALKGVSLGLAVLLWFVIAGEKTSEMGLQAPVELQNFPPELELTGDPVNSVEVRLRASPRVIHRLNPGDVSAIVDLRSMGEGEHIMHLSAEAIRVPFGVKVVKISPAILTLNLEHTLQKTVPIRPRLLGRPAPGYEVAAVESDPKEVRVSGPRSRLADLDSAYTEGITVEGASAAVVSQVNIGLGDPLFRIQGSPKARVTARIREVQASRTFEGLEVAVRGGRASVHPARVAVVLSGAGSVLKRLEAAAIHPYVELTDGGSGSLPVIVSLTPRREEVTVKEIRPAEVSVRRLRKKG